MASKPVKLKKLLRVLSRLGIEASRGTGSHVRLFHPGTGFVLFIHDVRGEVPGLVIRGLEKQLDNFNIVSAEEFQKMVH